MDRRAQYGFVPHRTRGDSCSRNSRCIAPPWLESELHQKLPLMAVRYALPLKALREAWARYHSMLRFYQPATINWSSAVDPKDVPYRELSKELGGILVYTNDHHL